jgi:hypothetical protein
MCRRAPVHVTSFFTAWTVALAGPSLPDACRGVARTDWPLWLPSVIAGLIIRRTRLHLLCLLAAGALPGALQIV